MTLFNGLYYNFNNILFQLFYMACQAKLSQKAIFSAKFCVIDIYDIYPILSIGKKFFLIMSFYSLVVIASERSAARQSQSAIRLRKESIKAA